MLLALTDKTVKVPATARMVRHVTLSMEHVPAHRVTIVQTAVKVGQKATLMFVDE